MLTTGCTAWKAICASEPNTRRATSQIPNRWKTSAYASHIRDTRAHTNRAVAPRRSAGPPASPDRCRR